MILPLHKNLPEAAAPDQEWIEANFSNFWRWLRRQLEFELVE